MGWVKPFLDGRLEQLRLSSKGKTVAEAVKKSAGRAWLSSILIIVAMVLTPVAIVSHWATSQVTNTERFVSTLSPLASNPEVQQVVIDEVSGVIKESVDIPKMTDSLFTGLGEALNLPEPAQKALEMLSTPVANGVDALITNVVTKAVESDAFQQAWTKTLTLTQEQTVALLSGDPESLIQLSNDGTLTLPLKPIIVDIKAALVKQGVGFANAIPEVDKSITLGQIPELALARVIYQVGVGVGTWLPWIVALMFAVGIFAARNRPRAIMATSIVFALVMGFMGFLFGTGRIVATTVIDPAIAGAVAVIYDAVVAYVINVVAALGVVAIFAAIAAWAFGSSESAAKLRAFSNKQIDTVRKAVDPQNKTFSGVSPVMNKYRVLARVLIIGIIAWIVALQQPVTVPMIIWNTLLILVLLFVYEVLQRTNGKPVVAAAAAAPSAPVAPAPSAAKPAAKKAPAKKPASQATTSAKPAAKKATTAKPAAKKAPAKKPVAKKPAAKKS